MPSSAAHDFCSENQCVRPGGVGSHRLQAQVSAAAGAGGWALCWLLLGQSWRGQPAQTPVQSPQGPSA